MSNNGIDFDFSDVFAGLERKVSDIEAAAKREMGDCMDDLLAESTNLAPLEFGTLRNSAWTEVESDGTNVSGAVYYTAVESSGGERFNYALYLHELYSLRDESGVEVASGFRYKNPTTRGTKPKFLSEPLKKNADTYKERISTAIGKAVKS